MHGQGLINFFTVIGEENLQQKQRGAEREELRQLYVEEEIVARSSSSAFIIIINNSSIIVEIVTNTIPSLTILPIIVHDGTRSHVKSVIPLHNAINR